MAVVMDREAIEAFLQEVFPAAVESPSFLEHVGEDGLTLARDTTDLDIRPGGTVSGPTLMTMADAASFYLVLSRVGPKALAVTSSLNIHFLRKAPPGRIRARARMLKSGRTLCVVDVDLLSDDSDEPTARATVTYALPRSPPEP